MSDINKMGIWERNKSIDERYIKQAKVDGMEISSFSLQSIIMMLTQEFGPVGKGWGYRVIKERFDEGVPIRDECTLENGDKLSLVTSQTHTLIIEMWYMLGDEKISMPEQAGHTKYISKTKYGATVDGEYYKKSLADAIKKSASMLGFAADIFLGLHDDPEYMRIKAEEQAIIDSANKADEIEKFKEQVNEWRASYEKNTLPHSVNAAFTSHCQEVYRVCKRLNMSPDSAINALKDASAKRIEQLKGK